MMSFAQSASPSSSSLWSIVAIGASAHRYADRAAQSPPAPSRARCNTARDRATPSAPSTDRAAARSPACSFIMASSAASLGIKAALPSRATTSRSAVLPSRRACSVASEASDLNASATLREAKSYASAAVTISFLSRSASADVNACTQYSAKRVALRSVPLFVAVITTRFGFFHDSSTAPLELVALSTSICAGGQRIEERSDLAPSEVRPGKVEAIVLAVVRAMPDEHDGDLIIPLHTARELLQLASSVVRRARSPLSDDDVVLLAAPERAAASATALACC